MQRPKPVMLMILDGWGIDPPGPGNAVSLARTPNLDRLLSEYSHTRLKTSGRNVGLPDGIMGNSEVGHLNIGAGRIVYQDLTRIDLAIEDGSFFDNATLNQAINRAQEKNSALHLMGLVSDGGVHSQLTHILALLDLAKRRGLTRVFLHAILDGRDTSPDSGQNYVAQVQQHMTRIGTGAIATLCGRYYAMDRDTRWDRTEKAYRLLTQGQGTPAQEPIAAIRQAYALGETDEFVQPVVMTDADQRPLASIRDDDAVIFFNFRADRTRQLTRAFTEPGFKGFVRSTLPKLSDFVCMTLYDASFTTLPIAFPPEHPTEILGQVVSEQGLRQLRIAETEKYAHVTYFFNGGEEAPFANEDRCMIPSPREVPTYDHKPEMSAEAVCEEVLQRIASERYDLIVLNFANMDMVGHTGIIPAAVKACETVDRCVGRIAAAIQAKGGALLITADHGNAETMIAPNGKVHTAHTTNPVHLVL
ncbi:MAG: 2,3-bisphosphoglycerate-independent phosphoglycerate mutase, partial [Desulfatitalea sp.]|nr:2,3-bisphosphoglycerate-independent phosphoglycerate mutase [Desulfatitalea sp.]